MYLKLLSHIPGIWPEAFYYLHDELRPDNFSRNPISPAGMNFMTKMIKTPAITD